MKPISNRSRNSCTLAMGASLLALAISFSSPAEAQQTQAETPNQQRGDIPGTPEVVSAPEQAAPERASDADLVITGSRIRGVAPVGSAVVAVTAADIQRTTASNVVDVLKKVPQVFGTGVTDAAYTTTGGNGGSNLTRGAALNLRGIAPSATLTLIDGQRITPSGVSAAFVDPTIIPTFALERIEIVPDGASAIYGSDAVAGVVNIIMRKSFEGAEFNYRYTFADGYAKHQAGLMVGHSWGSGRIVVAAEYTHNNFLETTERSYLYEDQRGSGGLDYRAGTCSPGNIIIGGVSYAVPATPTAAGLVAGTRNLCDVGYAVISPLTDRYNLVGYAEQSVGNSLKLSVQGFYNHRHFLSQFGQQGPSLNAFVTLTVPRTNAFFISPPGTNPASETVEFSYLPSHGPVTANGYIETYGAFGKAELKLPGHWKGELSGTHSLDNEIIYSRNINTAAQTAALASSNPATALDPFGNRTNPAVIDAIWTGLFYPEAHSRLSTAALRFDGPLFHLPGGAVRMAFGAEYLNAHLVFHTTRGTNVAPTFATPGAPTRTIKSGYAELYVPLFGPENATTGFQKLDLSVAGRYDHYSDFGGTWNPKVGLTWKPVRDLNLHASYGTSFRAPGLEQLLSNTVGIQVVTVVDPKAATGRTTGLAIRNFNSNLGPEKATTWSMGATLNPEALRDLRVSVNYFNLKYKAQIYAIDAADSLTNESIYGDLLIRNPTAAQVAATLNMGLPLLNPLPATIGFIFDSRPYNRGQTKTSGLDFEATYAIRTGSAGRFEISTNGLYFFNYKYQVSPLAPVRNGLNTITNPLRFRARAGADWELGGLNANIWVNYSNSYKNTTVTPVQTIRSWTTVDAHMGYDFGDHGPLSGLSLSVDVSNLFDARPPYANVLAGYDAQEANAFGRVVTLGVRAKF